MLALEKARIDPALNIIKNCANAWGLQRGNDYPRFVNDLNRMKTAQADDKPYRKQYEAMHPVAPQNNIPQYYYGNPEPLDKGNGMLPPEYSK